MYICDTVQRYLRPYLDGELEIKEVIRVHDHLKECHDCRNLYRFEKEFLDQCKDVYAHQRVEVPPEIKVVLLKKLGSEVQETSRRHFFARFGPIFAIAAVAFFVIAITTIMSSKEIIGEENPELIRSAVDNHIQYQKGVLSLDIMTGDPTEASKWFEGKVGFPVHLPAELTRNLTMEGGKIVNSDALQLAYLAYDLGGEKVSLVVTASSYPHRFPADRGIQFKGLTFYPVSYKGFETLIWTHQGISYVLVSKNSETVKQACAICHSSPSGNAQIKDFVENRI